MKKQELAKKLSDLSGRCFSFENENITVTGFSIEDPLFTLYTDGESIISTVTDADLFIKKLLKDEKRVVSVVQQRPKESLPEPVSNLFTEIISIAKSNIERVQQDPDYVEQAQEVRGNLSTMIDAVKTEIAFRKTLNL